MNKDLTMVMQKFYIEKSYSHSYILGFKFKGKIYLVIIEACEIANYMKLDKASRGAGYSLRFKPTTAQKMALLEDAQAICSAEFFESEVKTCIYNKGEVFEKLVTELNGQTWVKDNLPFWMGGDIEINGIAYQIKFEGATFMSEKQMFRMMEEA